RPRQPVSVDPLFRAAGRSGRATVGRQRGRFLRQRARRDNYRALQNRGDSPARSLAASGGGRIRNAGMGRLVQSSSAAGADRQRSAGGARGVVLSFNESVADGSLTQTRRSPENPGRFMLS